MKRLPTPQCVLSAILLSLAIQLTSVHAAITPDGNVEPDLPWTSSTVGYVGKTSDGTLTVDDGSDLESWYGYIGHGSGVFGTVTVDGKGSTWTINEDLYVGHSGNGALSITGGAAVSNHNGYINYGDMVTVDGLGSKWTTNYHLDINSGMLNITNSAAVNSYVCCIAYNSYSSTGVVTVDGTDSTLTTENNLTIGCKGKGTLTITNGGSVTSFTSVSIGEYRNSLGYPVPMSIVTVDGAGSKLTTTNSLKVGIFGNGTLNITGGTVNNFRGSIASGSDSTGVVMVEGTGSRWTNSENLYVGNAGSGMIKIIGGAAVSSAYGTIGSQSGSTGVATVDGSGSTWTNDGNLYVGNNGNGMLNVTGGGLVSAASVSINSQSLLAIDVGFDSLLNVDDGSGTITNNGKVRILAGAGATTGESYSPIAATTWAGSGVYQAVGGTWDSLNHWFTVSEVISGDAGDTLSLTLADMQRALVVDSGENKTGWTVGASFLHKTGDDTDLDFTASVIVGETLELLVDELDDGQTVKGAWDFTATGDGYSSSDPVYLSFDVGAGFSRSDLQVWHFNGTAWSEFDAMDLTYDGTYASFTATAFSGYAVSAVPEPGTFALLIAAALGLAALARSKRK